jgi:hypothetical protein
MRDTIGLENSAWRSRSTGGRRVELDARSAYNPLNLDSSGSSVRHEHVAMTAASDSPGVTANCQPWRFHHAPAAGVVDGWDDWLQRLPRARRNSAKHGSTPI